MKSIHNRLIKKYRWYRTWHNTRIYAVIHWALFVAIATYAGMYVNMLSIETGLLFAVR